MALTTDHSLTNPFGAGAPLMIAVSFRQLGQKRDIMETVDKFKSQKIRVLLIMTLQSQSNDVPPPYHRPLLQGEI